MTMERMLFQHSDSIYRYTELWLFCPFAGLPLGFFAPWLFHLRADSPPFTFAPWCVRPLACSVSGLFTPGWFAPSPFRWIYRWFVIQACVSICRKATTKCIVTSL